MKIRVDSHKMWRVWDLDNREFVEAVEADDEIGECVVPLRDEDGRYKTNGGFLQYTIRRGRFKLLQPGELPPTGSDGP
jgi:hypothetical protein